MGRTTCFTVRRVGFLVPLLVTLAVTLAPAQEKKPVETAPPKLGDKFVPTNSDKARPIYESAFDDAKGLKDWRLEGGERMSVAGGRLVLESDPKNKENHLVCWLLKEVPADFLLEFTVRPRDRKDGLNIVFFNTRGLKGEEIFDTALKARDGTYSQYYKGDINAYHVSYWAAGRGTANLRKSRGFHLVAEGKDLVCDAPADTFQSVRIYKKSGTIRVTVDDIVALAYDDDGKTYGPVHSHSGWVGLRQMGHTQRCEYGHVKVYPLKP